MPVDRGALIAPELSIIDAVLPELRDDERAFDGALRLLVTEALIFTDGCQREAAKMLRVSPRVICYWVERLNLRLKVAHEGAADASKPQDRDPVA